MWPESEQRIAIWHGPLAGMMTFPMRILHLAIAGWLNEEQAQKIEFLQEHVHVLGPVHRHERHGGLLSSYYREAA